VGGCEARIAQAVQQWHNTEQYEKYARNPTRFAFIHGSNGTRVGCSAFFGGFTLITWRINAVN
jgi:hypothetical protein